MKRKWLDQTLIHGPLFALCTSEKQFRKFHRKVFGKKAVIDEFTKDGAQGSTHMWSTDQGPIAIVCMRPEMDGDAHQALALLVHEAMHVWQHYLRSIGEESPSNEFEAYGVQKIAYELFRAYLPDKQKD